jgi:hypothetical protein
MGPKTMVAKIFLVTAVMLCATACTSSTNKNDWLENAQTYSGSVHASTQEDVLPLPNVGQETHH